MCAVSSDQLAERIHIVLNSRVPAAAIGRANEALVELRARLSAAEQECDRLQRVAERESALGDAALNLQVAAEARAEAAEAGFKAYEDSDGALPSDAQWAAIVAARAALARKETTP